MHFIHICSTIVTKFGSDLSGLIASNTIGSDLIAITIKTSSALRPLLQQQASGGSLSVDQIEQIQLLSQVLSDSIPTLYNIWYEY